MKRTITPAVALAIALALAGCTVPGTTPPPASATAAPSASSAAPTPAASQPGRTESESAQAAGIDLNNLPAPVAQGRLATTVSGDPNATLEVTLYGLRRSGKVLVATFSFKVATDQPDAGSGTLFAYLGGTQWAPYLVDPINLNRHDVLSAGDVRAATDRTTSQRFSPGSTFYAFAMFAAPPADVTAMDVQLVDGLPTAVGVPIT